MEIKRKNGNILFPCRRCKRRKKIDTDFGLRPKDDKFYEEQKRWETFFHIFKCRGSMTSQTQPTVFVPIREHWALKG